MKYLVDKTSTTFGRWKLPGPAEKRDEFNKYNKREKKRMWR